MNITITTKSGQKYLLKGEELLDGFRASYFELTRDNAFSNIARFTLDRFLSTYEKGPDDSCGRGPNCDCDENDV